MTDENVPPGAPGTAEEAPGAARPELDAPKPPSEPTRALPTEGLSAATPRKPSFWFLTIVSFVCLAADLGSKAWATSHLRPPRAFGDLRPVSFPVIDDRVIFKLAANPGGAFGLLQDESEAVRRPFFFVVSIAAVIFIVSLFRRLAPEQTALKWGLPLVLGGALGNLADRIRYKSVVDFIEVHLTSTYQWPTFNIADIAIVVGVGLMAIDMFTSRKPSPAASPAPATPQPAPAAAAEPAPAPDAKAEP